MPQADLEDDDIARDGETIRISMQLMDGDQRAVAAKLALIHHTEVVSDSAEDG